MQEWSLIKGQYNRYMLYVHAPKQTRCKLKQERQILYLWRITRFPVYTSAWSLRAHPAPRLPLLPPTIQPSPLSCCVSVLLALSFSLLLCPPHIFSLPILPLHLPQRPQIPSFSIYLQMRLSFIPLPCPPLSLPFDGGSKSLYFAIIF